ncbi:MAG TPA: metal ABC transporter permease [Thermoanaerobaculaceae bacterium]|nr:metal ABC transporter permease [Thermoanaerobaculaceae bacterium]HRS16262.1 metal ABC transporter permease [Thermoanaerobaculaceae bacterium]
MSGLFELEFMRLAAVAGTAAALALSILGVYVVLKRVVFVGLTLANVATLGAALAALFHLPLHAVMLAATLAGAAALAGAASLRRVPAESVVGWGFAAASGLTVLVLSRAGGDSDAMRLLFGNVLAITPGEAALMAGVALAVVTLHGLLARRFVLVVFDPEMARAAGIATHGWTLLLYLTVGGATAAAVHETGALLSFALLTLPAMAALLATRGLRAAFMTAAGIAVTATLAGLVLSFRWDLPAGPFAVVLLALAVPVAALVGRLRR